MSLQFYSQRARRGWQCRRSVRKNRRRTRKNVVDVYASTGGDRRGKVRLVGDGDVHFATGVVVDENSLLAWNWNWVLDWICSLWIWLWIWIWIWIWICCSSYRQQRTIRSPGGHTRLPNVCNRFLLIRDFQPTWSHDVVRQCCLRPSSTHTAWTLPRARRNRLASLMYFSPCTRTWQRNNSGNKGCATR